MTKFNTLYDNTINDLNVKSINEGLFDTFKSLLKFKSKEDTVSHSNPSYQRTPRNSMVVSAEKFNNYGTNSSFFKKQASQFDRIIDQYNHYVEQMKSLPIGTLKQGCTLMDKDGNLVWYNKSKKKYSGPRDMPCILTKSGILIFCQDNSLEMILTDFMVISIDTNVSIRYDKDDNSLSFSQLKVKLTSNLSKIPSDIKVDELVNFSPGLNEKNTALPSYISDNEIVYMNEKSQIHSTKHPAYFIKNTQPLYYLEGNKYQNAHEWLVELDKRSKSSSGQP